MRAEIVFEIRFGVAKRHVVLLEQRVYLEASLELKERDRSVRDRGVGGSNPLAPIKSDQANRGLRSTVIVG